MDNPFDKKPPVIDKAQFARASALNGCYNTCVDLLKSGVFTREGYQSGLFEAVIVLLLINLNDLVQKAAKDGKRITSTEHIQVTDKVADITDLISKCRNAACHISSPLMDVGADVVRFSVMVSKGTGMDVNGVAVKSEFTDDIAIFYGAHRLYLKRNIAAALRLIEQAYPDEVADDWMRRLSNA